MNKCIKLLTKEQLTNQSIPNYCLYLNSHFTNPSKNSINMSTALDLLSKELDLFINSNPNYQSYCTEFKQSALNKSVQELCDFNTYNCQQLKNYLSAILFIKYRQQAPLGSNYVSLYKNIIEAMQTISDQSKATVLKFMTDYYAGALHKEFNSIAKVEDFVPWLEVYDEFKKFDIDITNIENNLSLNITTKVWDLVEDIEKKYAEGVLLSSLAALAVIQKRNLDIESTIYSLFDSISRYLIKKYNVYQLPGRQRDENLTEGKNIIGKLKGIRLDDDHSKILEKLELSIGSADVVQEPEAEFVRPEGVPVTHIDFNTLVFQKIIYTNINNPRVHVNIYHYKSNEVGDVALKIYEAQHSTKDLVGTKTEIDILETLSVYSTKDNCFAKCYGSYADNSKVYIAMEYHPKTLMHVISEFKLSNTRLPDNYITHYTTALLQAFSFMETLNIFHQDIKPHNLLVTDNWVLKIIDFSISHLKTEFDATVAATGVHLIQGTQGYMAPELEENLKSKDRKARYRRNKADVFSLGITLLQMYSLEELFTLNYRENNSRLMEKVSAVKIEWFKTLLSKMLQVDYVNRPTFKECMQFLPKVHTTVS